MLKIHLNTWDSAEVSVSVSDSTIDKPMMDHSQMYKIKEPQSSTEKVTHLSRVRYILIKINLIIS